MLVGRTVTIEIKGVFGELEGLVIIVEEGGGGQARGFEEWVQSGR